MEEKNECKHSHFFVGFFPLDYNTCHQIHRSLQRQKIAKGKLFQDWITKIKMKIENTELTQCFADLVDKPLWNIFNVTSLWQRILAGQSH